jgi:hypothetical protein
MERRLAGLVVLLLALSAVVVVPALDGRRVSGTAVATTFPDAPELGDCLRAPFSQTAVSPGTPPEIAVTSTDLGPCGDSSSGEVVAFWSSTAEASRAPSSRFGAPCYRQAAEYAGLQSGNRSTDVPGAPVSGPVRWRPTIAFNPYLVVPGDAEKRAGRDWVACLAVPSGGVAYSGSLKGAFSGGLPAEYGLCFDSAAFDDVPVLLPCGQPHPSELLATGWVRDRSQVSLAEVEDACVQLAGRLIGAADPTRGGALRIVTDRLTGQSVDRSDGPLSVGCFAVTAGAAQLTGSVIGLGARPVPVAG